MNGLSHPILGDSSHGHSKTNREWKEKRNLPGERIALHLGRLQLVPTENIPEGIDVAAPLMDDMIDMLKVYAPNVLEQSLPILEKEGIVVNNINNEGGQYEVGKWTIPEALLQPKMYNDDVDVDILDEGEHYVVVSKPPVTVVHHSSWTGGKQRSVSKQKWKENMPMLQRVRDKTGRRVNLVHRLDRGASGCLLLSFAQTQKENPDDDVTKTSCRVTKTLIESMQSPQATKTYIALCDGDGTWNGVDYLEKGWFMFDNPVKDENGISKDAKTEICFVASTILPPTTTTGENDESATDNGYNLEGRSVSIILARPKSGRWHQVRKHLASGTIGHAILGDSSHGRSRTNRIWKKKRHLMKERVCLHLARLQLPATEYLQAENGIDVTCPLPPDLAKMLKAMPKQLLDEARPILEKEVCIRI